MNRGLKNIFTILAIAGLLYGLWYIRAIIAYVIAAVIISLVCRPLVKLLERIKIKEKPLPAGVLAGASLAIFTLLLTGMMLAFVPMINEQIVTISAISPDQINSSLEKPLELITGFIERYNLNQGAFSLESLQEKLAGMLGPDLLSGLIGGLTGWVGNVFIGAFSILFIAFFFIKESRLFSTMVFALVPDKYLSETKDVMNESKVLLSRYFIGMILQILCFSTLITIGLSLVGLENAIVIAFFAGLVNVIPYIGPMIGAGFALAITISSNLHLDFYNELSPTLALVLVVFIISQLIDNFVLQPIIYSKSVKAHPLEIFLVILVAGTIGGVAGMIIAIPLYTLIRIVAKEFLGKFKVVKSLTKDL